MNVLCPHCQSSVPVDIQPMAISCASCGLRMDLSQAGTAPGTSHLSLVQDFTDETIGDYNIGELVGVGGMGVVYKGTRKTDDLEVAVKVLGHDYVWYREEFVARFLREIKALAKLTHPGIVSILDHGQDGDTHYLVTEYVDGDNLAVYLKEHKLEPTQIIDIMLKVGAAISHAHQQGIVHRDIKPANIVIAGDTIKVLDFGLAQIQENESHLTTLTRTNLAIGTFNYLSPEQRTNAKDVDQRSDIFSLGIVLYEMLTGSLPLGNFQRASRLNLEAGKRFDPIVERCLSTDPQHRFQNVEDFIRDLAKIKKRNAVVARAKTVSKRVVPVAATVLCAAAGAALYLYLTPPVAQYSEGFELPIDDPAGEEVWINYAVAPMAPEIKPKPIVRTYSKSKIPKYSPKKKRYTKEDKMAAMEEKRRRMDMKRAKYKKKK